MIFSKRVKNFLTLFLCIDFTYVVVWCRFELVDFVDKIYTWVYKIILYFNNALL